MSSPTTRRYRTAAGTPRRRPRVRRASTRPDPDAGGSDPRDAHLGRRHLRPGLDVRRGLRPPRDHGQRRDPGRHDPRPGRSRAGHEPRRADDRPDRRAPLSGSPRSARPRSRSGCRTSSAVDVKERKPSSSGRPAITASSSTTAGRSSPSSAPTSPPEVAGAAGRQRRAGERGRARDPVGPRSGRPRRRQAAGLDHPGADRQPRPEARRDRDRREGVHARGRPRGCGPRSSASTARASGRRP